MAGSDVASSLLSPRAVTPSSSRRTTISVLHVLAPAPFGGLERVVETLARGHHDRGHRVAVASVLEQGEAQSEVHTGGEAGHARIELSLPSRRYLREREALIELIRRWGPDVVHTHGYRSDIIGGWAARACGTPTVTTVHGYTGGDFKNRLYEWLQTRSFRRFDAVVAVSAPLSEHLRRAGVSERRLHVIRNGWAPEPLLERAAARERLAAPPDVLHLGWVGRLSHEKGPDLFVEALGRLGRNGWTASIVGDGPRRGALERRARELGIADHVRWHGAVPAAARLFAGFDTFVMTSRTEGTPMVLFEAMAAGVPVLATRVGGVPDVVDEAEAALVPPDAASIADALRRMLDDRRSGIERAQRARQALERFAGGGWLERYERVYEALKRQGIRRVG